MDESTYDRIRREQREKARSEQIPSKEQGELLGKSLERVAEKIMAEVSDGLRKALGEPEPGRIQGVGSSRSFEVSAASHKEGARARVIVALTGVGPEFSDPEKVRYQLKADLQCKRSISTAPSNLRPIHQTRDMYGEGRPGINNMDVQSAVINTLTEP
jgi:hypothetical protein